MGTLVISEKKERKLVLTMAKTASVSKSCHLRLAATVSFHYKQK
jgi:hypothetical protein